MPCYCIGFTMVYCSPCLIVGLPHTIGKVWKGQPPCIGCLDMLGAWLKHLSHKIERRAGSEFLNQSSTLESREPSYLELSWGSVVWVYPQLSGIFPNKKASPSAEPLKSIYRLRLSKSQTTTGLRAPRKNPGKYCRSAFFSLHVLVVFFLHAPNRIFGGFLPNHPFLDRIFHEINHPAIGVAL